MSTHTAQMGMAQPSSPEEKSGLNKVMWFGIIPLLNIAAPFLVLLGAYQVKGRLDGPM